MGDTRRQPPQQSKMFYPLCLLFQALAFRHGRVQGGLSLLHALFELGRRPR